MIQKLPPLVCPQCQSTKVSPGFCKRRGRAFTRDDRIWCYDCKLVTNIKTTKVKSHNYNSHDFELDKEDE